MKKLLAVIIIGFGLTASANANDTIDGLNGMVDEFNKQKTLIQNHFDGYVESTKEFQKIKWQEGKDQLANNWNTILEFFQLKQ